MTIYSIEKHGSDYVVKADDQGLMIVGSRRRAAQLVIEASELLVDTLPAPLAPSLTPKAAPSQPAPTDPGAAASSITRDGPEVA